MKKIIYLLLFALFAIIGTIRSQVPLDIGRTQLNIGSLYYSSKVPYYVGIDFGITDDITCGIEYSNRTLKNIIEYHFFNTQIWYSKLMEILINGNYHFTNLYNMSEKWDLYTGLNVVYFSNFDTKYQNNENFFGGGVQIGTRYFWSDRMGLNFEIKATNIILTLKGGITFII